MRACVPTPHANKLQFRNNDCDFAGPSVRARIHSCERWNETCGGPNLVRVGVNHTERTHKVVEQSVTSVATAKPYKRERNGLSTVQYEGFIVAPHEKNPQRGGAPMLLSTIFQGVAGYKVSRHATWRTVRHSGGVLMR
jgi:hypothetical protein